MAKLPGDLSSELESKFQVSDNTLVRDVKDNPKDRITLEIGDSKQPDTFLPQAKIMRWDNDVNASFRYIDKEAGEPEIKAEGDVLKYIKPKIEFRAYELPATELSEDGGLELELLLKEKPDSNVFEFSIQTKGLTFHYQPPLTEQHQNGFSEKYQTEVVVTETQVKDLEGFVWAERPEKAIGSYAAYHATKGRINEIHGPEYKAGKAFHIFRPKAIDANENEIWAELNINEETGILTVTVDQDFLDNAVYPIIIDPDFGYTSIGASSSAWGANTMASDGHDYSPASDGTLLTLEHYSRANSGTANAGQALYDSDDNLIASAEQSINTTLEWKSQAVSPVPVSASGLYRPTFLNGHTVIRHYDSDGVNFGLQQGVTYPNWPDPASWSVQGYHDFFSQYATYELPSVTQSLRYAIKVAAAATKSLRYVMEGEVSNLPITPIFSQSNTQQTNTTTTLADSDVSIAAANLESGKKYLILYNAGYGGNDTGTESEVIVEYGGTVIARTIGEGSSSGTPEHIRIGSLHGSYILTGDGASDLKIRFRCLTASDTTYIAGKSLIAIPLESLTEDFHYSYAQQNGDTDEISALGTDIDNAGNTLLTLTKTLPAGDYLVLMSCELAPDSVTVNGEVKFEVDGSGQKINGLTAAEATTNKEYDCFSYAKVHTLGAGERIFKIKARSVTGSAADIRRGRIILIWLDNFDNYASASNTTPDTNTSATHETYVASDYTPNQEEYVLVVGNAASWQTNDFRSVYQRLRNTTDNVSFGENVGFDSRLFASGRNLMTCFGTEQISTTKNYALQYGVEQTSATGNMDEGDIVILGLTALIPGASETIEKSLKYTVKSAVAAQKSLKYAIPTTPSALTKSLRYAVSPANSVTKSLKYTVLADTALTKSLKYTIELAAAIQKSLTYEIQALGPSIIQKSLRYALLIGTAVTKSLKYSLLTTPSALAKSLKYTLLSPNSVGKSLKYTVFTTASAVTKSLKYSVLTIAQTTKSLRYSLLVGTAITKSLKYTVKGAQAVTKNLQYILETGSLNLQKSLKYSLATPQTITKQLKYTILTQTSITKNLEYRTRAETAVTKQLKYVVLNPESITKSLEYSVVITPSAKTLDLEYIIGIETAISKNLKYNVLPSLQKTLSLTYRLGKKYGIWTTEIKQSDLWTTKQPKGSQFIIQ